MASVSQRPPDARQHASVHWQRFSVPYEYPVHFTERIFDPANPVLADTGSNGRVRGSRSRARRAPMRLPSVQPAGGFHCFGDPVASDEKRDTAAGGCVTRFDKADVEIKHGKAKILY